MLPRVFVELGVCGGMVVLDRLRLLKVCGARHQPKSTSEKEQRSPQRWATTDILPLKCYFSDVSLFDYFVTFVVPFVHCEDFCYG